MEAFINSNDHTARGGVGMTMQDIAEVLSERMQLALKHMTPEDVTYHAHRGSYELNMSASYTLDDEER